MEGERGVVEEGKSSYMRYRCLTSVQLKGRRRNDVYKVKFSFFLLDDYGAKECNLEKTLSDRSQEKNSNLNRDSKLGPPDF